MINEGYDDLDKAKQLGDEDAIKLLETYPKELVLEHNKN